MRQKVNRGEREREAKRRDSREKLTLESIDVSPCAFRQNRQLPTEELFVEQNK